MNKQEQWQTDINNWKSNDPITIEQLNTVDQILNQQLLASEQIDITIAIAIKQLIQHQHPQLIQQTIPTLAQQAKNDNSIAFTHMLQVSLTDNTTTQTNTAIAYAQMLHDNNVNWNHPGTEYWMKRRLRSLGITKHNNDQTLQAFWLFNILNGKHQPFEQLDWNSTQPTPMIKLLNNSSEKLWNPTSENNTDLLLGSLLIVRQMQQLIKNEQVVTRDQANKRQAKQMHLKRRR